MWHNRKDAELKLLQLATAADCRKGGIGKREKGRELERGGGERVSKRVKARRRKERFDLFCAVQGLLHMIMKAP